MGHPGLQVLYWVRMSGGQPHVAGGGVAGRPELDPVPWRASSLQEQHNSIAKFLEAKGMPEQALEVATDPGGCPAAPAIQPPSSRRAPAATCRAASHE